MPKTDQQLRDYYNNLSTATQNYITSVTRRAGQQGVDTDIIMAADTHTSTTTRADAWDYFGDPNTNPYRGGKS